MGSLCKSVGRQGWRPPSPTGMYSRAAFAQGPHPPAPSRVRDAFLLVTYNECFRNPGNIMHKLLSVVLLSVLCHSACANACGSLSALSWMLGEWETDDGRRVTRETWRRVSDDTFEGAGETLDRDTGERRGYEALRLLRMDGEVFFLAKVPGNPLPVAFKLIHCTAHSVRFENAQHDFPTRLDYVKTDGGLRALVRGADGDGFELDFKPVQGSKP